MHQPDSDSYIETTIDGERVAGTVHYEGSSDISVRLEQPSLALVDTLHMPNFQRPLFPDGFLGDYGEQSALQLLEGLYREQKRGTARRKAFAVDCEEFGRVRYLVANPGHAERNRSILGRGEINSNVRIEFEDDGPYRYARLFDSGTGQPFLGESSVFENGVEEDIAGVRKDLAFRLHIKRTRRRLLSLSRPALAGGSEKLPRSLGRAWSASANYL
jgi:hypothetical protein